MAEHTPGPWIYVWREDRLQWRIGPDNGDMPVAATFNQWPKDLELANARLIAAAPKLLEAAHIGWDWLRNYLDSIEDGKDPDAESDYQFIDAAIRQAEEGKENEN